MVFKGRDQDSACSECIKGGFIIMESVVERAMREDALSSCSQNWPAVLTEFGCLGLFSQCQAALIPRVSGVDSLLDRPGG